MEDTEDPTPVEIREQWETVHAALVERLKRDGEDDEANWWKGA